MNTRREFLMGSLAATAALAIASPAPARASYFPFAGIIYTSDSAGMWAGKVEAHMPKVERKGDVVSIATNHPMSAEHFIVRHTLVLADGTVAGSRTFQPSDAKAVSTIELPATYTSKFYVTSFCNKHDFWVTEVD